jgi:hypothetical protein
LRGDARGRVGQLNVLVNNVGVNPGAEDITIVGGRARAHNPGESAHFLPSSKRTQSKGRPQLPGGQVRCLQ